MNHLDIMTKQPTDTRSDLSDLKSLVDVFRNDAMGEDIQKIIHDEIEVKDLPIIKKFESVRNHCHDMYLTTTFDTNREQEQSEFIKNNISEWINTAEDSVDMAVNIYRLGEWIATTVYEKGVTAIPAKIIKSSRTLVEKSQAIYHRSITQALVGTECLCATIAEDNKTRNNPAVVDAVKNYKKDLEKYKVHEINIKDLKKSFDKIAVNVLDTQLDKNSPIINEVNKTELLWDIVLFLGVVIAAPLIIGGGTLLALFSLLKK